MEQSATYQAIVQRGREEGRKEGRIEEARRFLLLQGEEKFGSPDDSIRAVLDSINGFARLEKLAVRLINADSWHDLLPAPSKRRGNGRRKPKD